MDGGCEVWQRLGWIDGVKVASGHFCLAVSSFGPPSRALMDYHLEMGGMPLHDAVGVNSKMCATMKIKANVHSLRSYGCVLDDYVRVI